jgi:hypothetical protein
MGTIKMAGMALIVVGVLGLLYGAFSYTKNTHRLHLGGLELALTERETVNIPVWVGVGALVAGGLMLVVPGRKWGA